MKTNAQVLARNCALAVMKAYHDTSAQARNRQVPGPEAREQAQAEAFRVAEEHVREVARKTSDFIYDGYMAGWLDRPSEEQ